MPAASSSASTRWLSAGAQPTAPVILSAANRPDSSTIGTPTPGWVFAPQKTRFSIDAVQRRTPQRSGLEQAVAGRERRSGRDSHVAPVGRRDQPFDLDAGVEAGQAALLHGLDHLVAVARAQLRPVQVRSADGVRAREQRVVGLLAVRGQRRIGRGRVADQERRIAHQLALADDLVEGRLPGGAEIDGVVQQVVVAGLAADVQQHAGRRVVEPLDRLRRVLRLEQLPVGDRQVGVDHDHVGVEPLAVGGDHAAGPARVHVDVGHLGVVTELHAGVGRGGGQCDRQGVHAALGEEHPLHAVHVGDDRVDGQRVLRGEPGVHRLERENAAQPLVGQVGVHHRRQFAQPAQRQQLHRRRADQAGDAVEVGVDERRALQLVHLRQVVDEASVAVDITGAAVLLDLGGHRVEVGVHVQHRPVGEAGAVARVDLDQLQPVGQRLADAVQRVLDQLGHGQHGGAGVELEAVQVEATGAAARNGFPLQHGDRAAGSGESQGGGQAAEAGADDDHRAGASRNGSHAATVPVATAGPTPQGRV